MCVIVARLDNEESYQMSLLENCKGMSPANQALWHWLHKMKADYGLEIHPKNFNEFIEVHKPCMISWCRYLDGLGLVDLAFEVKLKTERTPVGLNTTIISETIGQGTVQPLSQDVLKL